MFNEERDIISEIKLNEKLTKNEKIKKYKDYLLDDCNYRLPDIFLEFVAREHLDLKYREEEIINMREQFHRKQEEIEEQNKLAEIKENETKNRLEVLEELQNEIIVEEI